MQVKAVGRGVSPGTPPGVEARILSFPAPSEKNRKKIKKKPPDCPLIIWLWVCNPTLILVIAR